MFLTSLATFICQKALHFANFSNFSFGEDENSLTFLQKLTAHRRYIESKLVTITTRFIQGMFHFLF